MGAYGADTGWFVCRMCGLCEEVGEMCGLCVENVVKVGENSQKQPNMWFLWEKMWLGTLLHTVKPPRTCFMCILSPIHTHSYAPLCVYTLP